MKFNKLILGLAAAPLLLASCNNSISYAEAQKWVESHYTTETTKTETTIVTINWDFHASVIGDKVRNDLTEIFKAIAKFFVGKNPEHTEYFKYPGDDHPIGQKRIVKYPYMVTPLNIDTWGNSDSEGNTYDYTFDTEKSIFKISDNSLTVNFPYSSDGAYTATRAYTFDSKGYPTGFGHKIDRTVIDSNNVMKVKFTVDFAYAE